MSSPRKSRIASDHYQRLHEAARQHALQLRQEAISDAGAWMARILRRGIAHALQLLRKPIAPARSAGATSSSSSSSPAECNTPCPHSC